MILDGCLIDTLIIHIIEKKNSLMYVLSVCTALHMPSPASDTAFTLILYSVPASSLVTMVEFTVEPEMVT